jgi:hypothetical protein
MLIRASSPMELHHLIDLQSSILDDYIHNVWTAYGLYVLAIGWIITSDKSRSFLRNNLAARRAVGLAAVLILFIEMGILFFLRHKSESLYEYIKNSELWQLYAKQSSNLTVLEVHRITILFPIISSIIAAILCFTFISMIVYLKESRDTLGQPAQ